VKQPRPRKHHYLPQFYLRGFSEKGTHLYQIEKCTGKSFGASILDTAAIRDFHKLDFNGCTDPEALEKFVSKVEGLIAPALDSVLHDEAFTRGTRVSMDHLTSMLMARVPATKDMVEDSIRENVRSVGLLLEKHGGLPPKPLEVQEALSLENLRIDVGNWHVMQHMFALAFDDDILRIIGRCQAELLRAPTGKQFITGDQPVAQFNADARPEESDPRGGLADPDTVTTLPLSSELALVLSNNGRGKGQRAREATPAEVDEINRRTIIMSSDRLFACSIDDSVRQLLLRYGHCTAGAEIRVTRTPDGVSHHVLNMVPVMDQRLYEPLGARQAFTPIASRPYELRLNRGAVYPMVTTRINLPNDRKS
jgi:hypothetical protein